MGRLQDFLGGGGVWVLGYVLAIAPHGWLVLSDPTWTLLLPFLLQLVCVAKLYVALSWPSPGKEATSEPGKEATPEPGKESTLKPGAACSPSLAGCGETVESRTESALSWLAARGLLPDEGVCPCRFSANKDRAGLNLCEAAAKGDLRRIRKLIAAGADVNECNYDGRTALHISTRNADVPIVTKLLEAGADMVVRDVFGNTPWHHATVNLVVAPRDAHHAHAVIVAFENARKARPANEQLVEQLRQAVVRGAAGEVNALAEQGRPV
ncbi:hypothetical protein T484DRAFT_1792880 [Baffinella frigidus]|nr:hypothetical protein T484DRAFT_1792880 [Cryptophyta sp. CCMP2293]